MGGAGGELVQVMVTDVTATHVTLDANPPLAGKDLNFQIELVAIG
jgi:peptidylprolyl isomerase